MYSIANYNIRKNCKNTDIYTPLPLAYYIYDLIKNEINKDTNIVDPAYGEGNLLMPFIINGYKNLYGYDIKIPIAMEYKVIFNKIDFLNGRGLINICYGNILAICNPPFNNTNKFIKINYPYEFLKKIFSLYGKDTKIILFCLPHFLLDQTTNSKRFKDLRDNYPGISSILTLPLNIFEGIRTQSIVLFYNFKNLKPHYFLPEYVIREIKGE